MSETRINTELLARVRDHILEEPRRYDQDEYCTVSTEAPCGTAACVAGWSVLLGAGKPDTEPCRCGSPDCVVERWPETAVRLLGIEPADADILFSASADNWPEPYRRQFKDSYEFDERDGMAKAAADYIDHIIATGKVTD